jgi:hypothetical protein
MEKSSLTDNPGLGRIGNTLVQAAMNKVQAARLFSSNMSERDTFPINLAVVCVWSFAGVPLTALELALGFGVEIGQALASADRATRTPIPAIHSSQAQLYGS